MKRARVLLADDDACTRAAFKGFLRSSAFDVVGTVADGQAALEQGVLLAPDVIVLDINVPYVSGLEALPGSRACLPAAAIVIVTSDERLEVRDQALRLGAHAFVVKRFVPSDLISAIQSALTARRMDRHNPRNNEK